VLAQPTGAGIGHTRWATHGRVCEENAHPHYDTDNRVHVVVNGIVENYVVLREELGVGGAVFTSETDAEVMAHLVASFLDEHDLEEAVRLAYGRLRGHYAFVAMAADEPQLLVAARKECPLVIGRGQDEQFVASAIPAFLAYTRRVQYIENGDIVSVRPEGVSFSTADGVAAPRVVQAVDWDADVAEKGGYETFMLKEIHEQAEAIAETIADRTTRPDGVDLPGLGQIDDAVLAGCRRIVVVACGTSYHAGLIGRYAIEQWARVPVEMDVASEYRYRDPVLGPGDLVIGLSQSGETADTLAAMRLGRERGAAVLAITNVMGSQATREADGVLFTRAGLEVGVAATKTFVAQVAAMYLLGLRIAELRGTLPPARLSELVSALKAVPHCVAELLAGGMNAAVERVAERHHAKSFFLYLGRRRLRGGRDEARPHRAPRAGHPRRRGRNRFSRPRQDRFQHAGGARTWRARDRGGDRGQRDDRTACRRALAGAGDRLDAPADPGRDPAAAAGLPRGAAARAERRSAAQPGEDGHRRVAGRKRSRPAAALRKNCAASPVGWV
jgi:glucosamine--fructose-6-phosphate aminotransferase (isomerizing)